MINIEKKLKKLETEKDRIYEDIQIHNIKLQLNAMKSLEQKESFTKSTSIFR